MSERVIRLYSSLVAGTAQPVLCGQPGVSVSARLSVQTVVTQSDHRQCLPQPLISLCAQVVCHSLLSFYGHMRL